MNENKTRMLAMFLLASFENGLEHAHGVYSGREPLPTREQVMKRWFATRRSIRGYWLQEARRIAQEIEAT